MIEAKDKARRFQTLIAIVVVLRYLSFQKNLRFERQIITTREFGVVKENTMSQRSIDFSKTHFWAYLEEGRNRCEEISSTLRVSGEGIEPEDLVGRHNCFPVDPRSNICKVGQVTSFVFSVFMIVLYLKTIHVGFWVH